MFENLLIHICVHIFLKIKDLNIHLENKFNFDNLSIFIIIIQIFHYIICLYII